MNLLNHPPGSTSVTATMLRFDNKATLNMNSHQLFFLNGVSGKILQSIYYLLITFVESFVIFLINTVVHLSMCGC